ncbi:MAG: hypothetical protein GY882_10270, partial [Actinomycetia bacterium]|nr:hypothetical protein [Actinomycetes bacterium]
MVFKRTGSIFRFESGRTGAVRAGSAVAALTATAATAAAFAATATTTALAAFAAATTTTTFAATSTAELLDHRPTLLIAEFAVAVLVEPLHELGSLLLAHATAPAAATATATTALRRKGFLLLGGEQGSELLDVAFVDSFT